MKNLVLTLMLTVFVGTSANAGVLLEPYMGMHFNSSAELTGVTDEFEVSGMGLGARLGYQNLGLMLGLNYKTAAFEFKPKTGSTVDIDHSHYGLFVGYNLPVMVRFWAEYVVGGSADVKDGGNFEKITGTQLGIGYTGLPFISLNFELGNLKYDDFKDQAGASSSSTTDLTTYMLSVSLPITL